MQDIRSNQLGTAVMAKTVARYQGSVTELAVKKKIDFVYYQLKQMIDKTELKLQRFNEDALPEQKTALARLFKASQKIAQVLSNCNKNKEIFMHGDLLPNSVYVDIENNKVMIVDWEYSGYGYWSSDLALVSCSLTLQQMCALGDMYHNAQLKTIDDSMPADMLYLLQMNRFAHQYLSLAWIVNQDNYADKIDIMLSELDSFEPGLNSLYRQAEANPNMFFKYKIPYAQQQNINADEIPLQGKIMAKL